MAKVLFLAHRAPFPPNKGDKIRAYHVLQHLSARHDIWLGAATDDPADLDHLATAKARFQDAYFGALSIPYMRANMLRGAADGRPLSVARFYHQGLAKWTRTVVSAVQPDLVYIFSSAPAQYVLGRLPAATALIVDYVDADAEKWRAYAATAPIPQRWIYASEFRRLVRFDSRLLKAADAGILVSETDRRLLAGFAPEGSEKLQVISNGVDVEYFAPPPDDPAPERNVIVFAGTMDYKPNIDAVCWFTDEIFPQIRRACPQALFRIVGAKPSPEVRALGIRPGVDVVGGVPDMRPYLFEASVVVAPLRIARGIQNKVLEGMAAGRPVVVTPQALDGIAAEPGRHLLVGADAGTFASSVTDVLAGRAPQNLGPQARQYVLNNCQWGRRLEGMDQLIAHVLERRLRQVPA